MKLHPVRQQWWPGVMWSHRWPEGCSDLPDAFSWRSCERSSCRYTPNSTFFCLQAHETHAVPQREVVSQPLSSTCRLLANFCWVTCPGWLCPSPYPRSPLIFVQAVWERQMDVFDGCCCWGGCERRDVERRGRVVLWGFSGGKEPRPLPGSG